MITAHAIEFWCIVYVRGDYLAVVDKSIVNTHLLLPLSDKVDDGVVTYARELLTLGLIWLQFYDAVKEGDGDRIVLAWKMLIPVFKATNHVNYLKEAVNLVLQTQILSQRKAGQLLWSRHKMLSQRKAGNCFGLDV